jgi:DNA modification methylase
MEYKKISEIKLLENNPRTISDRQFKILCTSIKKNIDYFEARPLILSDRTGELVVIAGNQRYKAAESLGLKEVPTYLMKNLTEETEREIVIRDNISNGDWDFDLLANEWNTEELEDWGLEGFPFEEVTELEAEEDDYTEPDNIQVDVVLGDLIEIGEHRLLCGDSTDSDQVAKLMNGEKADISFTSPPYNAGTTPTEVKMGKTSKYANDDDNKSENEYLQLLKDFTNNTLLFSQYSFVNIQSLSGNKTALIDFLYEMKSFYADTIIWQKQNSQPAMAENVLNSQYEYIHCFSHKANRAIGTKKFRGTISNVLEISKQTKNKIKEHNATFPIDLAEFVVSNFCENSVLDVFLGSGTTMVASHQLKRKCYGMELDPKYCQVIIDRMSKLDPSLEVKINEVVYNK